MNNDLYSFLIKMAALIICITIHEFAHALSAYRAGDDTPKLQGRISLNPIDHLDPLGTIMMVVTSISGLGVGWGKPVMINSVNFRSPRWDNLRVSLWGPLSNLVTAAVLGTILRFAGPALSPPVYQFLIWMFLISIGLAMFNLLPVAPLDGSHILSALLPIDTARRYDDFMHRYGMIVFIGLIFIGGGRVIQYLIGPPAYFLSRLFLGG